MTNKILPEHVAPWFRAPTLHGSERYAFDTVAGHYVVLLFAGSAAQPPPPRRCARWPHGAACSMTAMRPSSA